MYSENSIKSLNRKGATETGAKLWLCRGNFSNQGLFMCCAGTLGETGIQPMNSFQKK